MVIAENGREREHSRKAERIECYYLAIDAITFSSIFKYIPSTPNPF
jgi:hypothetical protein